MITDLELCALCANIEDPMQLTIFDHLFSDDQCFAGVKYVGADSVLVFRGSKTPLDWFNDLREEPIDDPQLGCVHGGMFYGLRDWHQRFMEVLQGGVYIVGHSLGASRAFLSAALMMINGTMPKAIVGVGCPRPGYDRLSQIIAECPDARWYRNRHDPVTYVPYRLGNYVHAGAMRLVNAPGRIDDPWLFLADHHVALYHQGMLNLTESLVP